MEKCNIHLTGRVNSKLESFNFHLYFQSVFAVSFLFAMHVLGRQNHVHRLNILSPHNLPKINPRGCFKSKRILGGNEPDTHMDIFQPYLAVEAAICVKKDDLFVSEAIAKTGAWEADNVHNLMKAVSQYEDAVFVGMSFIMIAYRKRVNFRRGIQPRNVQHHGGLHGQACDCCGCNGR